MLRLVRVLNIILELLARTGGLTKCKLTKLLFLVDVEYKRLHGETLTGLEYRRGFFGPYSPDIDKLLRLLYRLGLVHPVEEEKNGRRVVKWTTNDRLYS